MVNLIERSVENNLNWLLAYFPAVGLVGPRQVGKTTLASMIGDRLTFFFYRTQQGAECDIVLVKGAKSVADIEIKFSSAPVLSRCVYSAVADLGTVKNFVLIPADEDYPLQKTWQVCGLRQCIAHHLPGLI